MSTTTEEDITTNETQVADLQYQTPYFWRVYALDSTGNTSLASEEWVFTTGLPAVLLISPAHNSINTTYDLQLVWSQLDIADEYDLEVSTNSDMSQLVRTEYGTTDLTHPLTGLEDYTTYYWRVRGNSNGEDGTWSPVWSFRTKMLGITHIAPMDDQELSLNKTTLQWEAPKGPVTFDLLVYVNGDVTDTLEYRTDHTKLEFNLVGLDSNQVYCWTVRGLNADRTSSTGWTTPWCFTTPTVSVREHNPDLVYGPNPTRGEIAINGNGKGYISYTVISMTGREMKAEDIGYKENFTVDLSGLATGAYFILLNTPTGYELVPVTLE